MKNENSSGFWHPRTIFNLSIATCFLVGLVFVLISDEMSIWGPVKKHELFTLTLRDLGLAFCIASLVAVLFEIHQFTRHRMESMTEVFNAFVADKVTSEVWDGFLDLIEQKVAIRRDVTLRLELERPTGLPQNQAILKVEHSYKLYPLRNRRTKYDVNHELDYEDEVPDLKLPRWELAVIVPDSARTRAGIPINTSGSNFADQVELPSRNLLK